MISAYEYHATFISNYDGDTIRLGVDLGLDTYVRGTFRLYGVQCPEMRGETLERARMVRDAVCARLKGKSLEIRTIKDRKEKYGRYLVQVWIEGDPESLNDWLVRMGHATAYMVGAHAANATTDANP